jgi:hypothetical protein
MTSPFWNLVYALIAIAVVGFLVVYVISFFRVRFYEIPEEERWVIYRLGRFNRVAGPGWTFIPSRLERIVKKFNVRPQPKIISVYDLFMYGTPFGYSLSFWVRTDLLAAAKKMRAENEVLEDALTRLALFSDAEIHQELAIKAKKALQDTLGKYERENPLPKNADFVQTLLPVIPGLPTCDRLLKEVRVQLENTLPSIGVFFDNLHPLTIISLLLGDDIISSFRQGRMGRIIREQFPNLTDQEIMLVIENAIGGTPFEQRIHLDGPGTAAASVELRDDDNNRRIKFYPGGGGGQSGANAQGGVSEQTTTAPPTREPPLTKEDLGILKRVPRAAGGQRAAS